MKILKRVALMLALIVGGFIALLFVYAQFDSAPSASPDTTVAAPVSASSQMPDDIPILPVAVLTNMVGCESLGEMQSIAKMIKTGHKKNAALLMMQQSNNGACQEFLAGETVYVESVDGMFAKVERPGESAGYWMVGDALAPPK